MVRHHVLIGLGFKKQHFRNRALHYMLNRGSGFYTHSGSVRLGETQNRSAVVPSNQMTIKPVAPQITLPKLTRQPLKFNY